MGKIQTATEADLVTLETWLDCLESEPLDASEFPDCGHLAYATTMVSVTAEVML